MTAHTETPPTRDGYWLLGLCVLGLVLRCLTLNSGLWYDEILTLVEFIRLPVSELTSTYTSLNNHVFYSLQAHAAVALFGEHPWVIRAPAVLFGAAGIAALWDLGRASGLRTWEVRLSTLLLAVSYHHIWFSQNARGYSGLVFWSLLATAIFIRHFNSTQLRPWLLYAACVAAAGYTHLTAAFLFAAHAAAFIVVRILEQKLGRSLVPAPPPATDASPAKATRGLPRPLLGLMMGGLFTVLLHAPMLPQMAGTFSRVSGKATATAGSSSSNATPARDSLASAEPASKPPTSEVTSKAPSTPKVSPNAQKNPLWTLMEVVRSLGDLGPLLALAVPLSLVLLLVGGLSLARSSSLLVAIHALHVPLTLAILLLGGMRIWPRYFLVDIGFIFICLTRGLFVTSEFIGARLELTRRTGIPVERFGIGAVVAAALASLTLLPKNYQLPKQDYQGPLDYIHAQQRAEDNVAVVGLANLPYAIYYKPGWNKVETPEELQALRAKPGATWLVYAFPSHAHSRFPDVMALVERDFEKMKSFPGSLGDGSVVVMRSAE